MSKGTCPRCGLPVEAQRSVDELFRCPGCDRLVTPSTDSGPPLLSPDDGLRSADTPPLQVGADFCRDYRLGPVVGEGAMGTVYRGLQLSTGRVVAIKFLTRIDSDVALTRFLAEGKLLARVTHPNVVRVFDVGEALGHPYLVTELMEGGTLEDRLQAGRPLKPADAVMIARQCLFGLSACHEAGIVHRDLKPANILFSSTGEAKIADLGIARQVDATWIVTATGSCVGTPRYMSPEQVRGETAEVPADLYAMGVLIYEMLCGKPPFDSPLLPEILSMHLTAKPPPIGSRVAGLPDALARLVHQALSKRPGDRPRSALAFAESIYQACQPSKFHPRPGPDAGLLEPDQRPARLARAPPIDSPARRRAPLRVACIGAALLTVLVWWGYACWHRHRLESAAERLWGIHENALRAHALADAATAARAYVALLRGGDG
ncbi:MAG: serine/threonine protein kinase, partial [Candidatus Riflebacteria bacterium]|nr:serine/threonine protein kinase [Candidatus Riflebacteria bacterium]